MGSDLSAVLFLHVSGKLNASLGSNSSLRQLSPTWATVMKTTTLTRRAAEARKQMVLHRVLEARQTKTTMRRRTPRRRVTEVAGVARTVEAVPRVPIAAEVLSALAEGMVGAPRPCLPRRGRRHSLPLPCRTLAAQAVPARRRQFTRSTSSASAIAARLGTSLQRARWLPLAGSITDAVSVKYVAQARREGRAKAPAS